MMQLFFAALAAAGAFGGTPLPVEADRWKLVLLEAPLEPHILKAGVEDCGGTPCLRIGPWRAGRWAVRYEFIDRLPSPTGTIRGRFRTVGLYPKQATVRVQWFKGDATSVSNRNFPLASSSEWSDFAIPVLRPPAGAEWMRVGFGLEEHSEGTVWFRDLRFSAEAAPPAYPKTAPLTRPSAPSRLAASKYTRVERHEGTWWLVRADGAPFFSLGTLVSLRNPTAEFREEREAAAHLRRMGFNSIAASSSLSRWAAFNEQLIREGGVPFHQFRNIEIRVGADYDTLVDRNGNNPGASQAQAAAIGGFNHAFPDPFDPRWEADVRRQVREGAERVRGKQYFTAWFAGNERTHNAIHRYVYAPNCARALRSFLEARYHGGIEALNRAWGGERYESWDQLLEKKPDPAVRHGAMYEDFRAFSREILRKINRTMIRAIRDEDPGRLIISNRFMVGERRDVFDNLDLYREFDIIAVNIYPLNLTAGLARDERQFLELVHEKTGKPVLIGEWSVPALDSGLYNNPLRLDWSFPQTVGTQTERARQAARILADFYNLPFIVGAHWFTWADIDTAARQANRGLFKANREPWTQLQESLAEVARRIAAR